MRLVSASLLLLLFTPFVIAKDTDAKHAKRGLDDVFSKSDKKAREKEIKKLAGDTLDTLAAEEARAYALELQRAAPKKLPKLEAVHEGALNYEYEVRTKKTRYTNFALIDLPSGVSADKPAPLVIGLHSALGTAWLELSGMRTCMRGDPDHPLRDCIIACPQALNRVGARLVARFAALPVGDGLVPADLAERDPARRDDRLLAPTVHERDAGQYLVRAPGQRGEHPEGLVARSRLAEDALAENDRGIRAEQGAARARRAGRTRLGEGEPAHVGCGELARDRRLVDVLAAVTECEAETLEYLAAAWRGRGQVQRRGAQRVRPGDRDARRAGWRPGRAARCRRRGRGRGAA